MTLKHDNYQIKGLSAPIWGVLVPSSHGRKLKCANCGSENIYYSGTPESPEEILGETVRCGDCGWLTDWYEDFKAGKKFDEEGL